MDDPTPQPSTSTSPLRLHWHSDTVVEHGALTQQPLVVAYGSGVAHGFRRVAS